jgi:hypothetical protein
VNFLCIEQNSFGQGGFSGINVSHNPYVSDLGKVLCHDYSRCPSYGDTV